MFAQELPPIEGMFLEEVLTMFDQRAVAYTEQTLQQQWPVDSPMYRLIKALQDLDAEAKGHKLTLSDHVQHQLYQL